MIPHGRYKAITFVCGLRLRGVVAPKAYDRAMTAETFEAWLDHHLLPTLEEGDIVLLDNPSVHKSPRVAEILAKKNCTVRYLPPYSPDFNPIEKAYSKLKAILRKLAERTVAGLIAMLEGCTLKPKECENFFATCGFRSSDRRVRRLPQEFPERRCFSHRRSSVQGFRICARRGRASEHGSFLFTANR
jgi:transposase